MGMKPSPKRYRKPKLKLNPYRDRRLPVWIVRVGSSYEIAITINKIDLSIDIQDPTRLMGQILPLEACQLGLALQEASRVAGAARAKAGR